ILSPSCSAQSKEQDDKTMKEAKGKSLVESVTGYKDLNAEFQDCSKSSSNEVPTASTTVSTVGQNSLNSTNTFRLENIIYSDDEDVVGAEADFNNLESSIPVNPIPTTSIHKDHPISQIIGDLSSTTQTRSMTRAVKDQVKVIRSDNGTEFKNSNLNQFCGLKGIKREFSVPRTPQQNGIPERKNKTLIEAARTMLTDSLLPIPFWVEAVNIACYVQNRILVTKPHNKTHYELLHGRSPSIGFMRPFGCPVTILNTLDHLGKFQGKVDEEFLVGYSVCSKAFRVFNNRTRIIQETLHANFMENKQNVAGTSPTWMFDIDSLSGTMNYHPVTAGNQTNSGVGFQDNSDAEKAGEEVDQSYMLFPVWSSVGSTNPHNNAEDAAFDGKE
nr:retrovirus-related Pol polyprotein from transposon TNT 1-94 [Tanacetum cinerariifolium]